jgi:recombinational DNA repair protein RecR
MYRIDGMAKRIKFCKFCGVMLRGTEDDCGNCGEDVSRPRTVIVGVFTEEGFEAMHKAFQIDEEE